MCFITFLESWQGKELLLLTTTSHTCTPTMVYAATRSTQRTRSCVRCPKLNFSVKTLQRWASKGALNVATGLWLVQARQFTLDQGLDVVKQRFDNSITGLHRCGFEVLACESFAEFAQESGDEVLTTDYMRRPHEVHVGWGGLAKLQQMEKRYGNMFRGRFGVLQIKGM